MAAPNTVTSEHPIGGGTGPSFLGGPGGKIGFFQDPFGGGGSTQRTGPVQQIITVSQTAGYLSIFQSNSQKEPTTTAQNISSMSITLTGAPMLSTADLVFVN